MKITRRFEWDAGHRITRHESKCRHPHGHRYVAEVEVQSDDLDEVGRVIDFGVLKEAVGGWIDREWDHAFLLCRSDPLVQVFLELAFRVYVFDAEPTAETMVSHLWLKVDDQLPAGLWLRRIRIYETPNCWAEITRCPEAEVP